MEKRKQNSSKILLEICIETEKAEEKLKKRYKKINPRSINNDSKSYAKINLSLIVNSKRKDNLHEIQSLFCLIDLADKIKLNKIEGKKDKIIFNGPFSHLINKKNNSIINLLNLLRKLRLISKFYSIVVTKNFPVN